LINIDIILKYVALEHFVGWWCF